MMVVEIVLVISDEIRASPSGKGSIRKNQTEISFIDFVNSIFSNGIS